MRASPKYCRDTVRFFSVVQIAELLPECSCLGRGLVLFDHSLTTVCTTGTRIVLPAIARFPADLSLASMGTPKMLNPTRTTQRLRCTYRPRNFPSTTKSVFSRPKTTSAGRPAPSRVEQESLPWAEYLTVRKNKRRWETVRVFCESSCLSLLP